MWTEATSNQFEWGGRALGRWQSGISSVSLWARIIILFATSCIFLYISRKISFWGGVCQKLYIWKIPFSTIRQASRNKKYEANETFLGKSDVLVSFSAVSGQSNGDFTVKSAVIIKMAIFCFTDRRISESNFFRCGQPILFGPFLFDTLLGTLFTEEKPERFGFVQKKSASREFHTSSALRQARRVHIIIPT